MGKRKLTTAQIAVLIAIATLASKLLGFVREMLMANFFGASMITDAYVMGLSVPNTLLAAVVTAVGTAYMPILAAKFEGQGKDSANKYTSQLLNLMLVIVAIVYAICVLLSDPIISIFAPGYIGETKSLTIYFMRLGFITLFFTVGVKFFDSYLRYRGEFSAQKFIACTENIIIIIFLFIAAKINYKLMIFGVIIGSGINCLGQAYLAHKKGFRYSFSFDFGSSVREVIALSLPVFIGGSFSELNTFIDKILASTLVEGSVTALNYSSKLITLVLTFTVEILSLIIYPKLNQAYAKSDYKRISDLSGRGINLLAIVSIPCALGAMIYSEPITKIVFERGAFEASATNLVAVAFFFYAIRIPFYGVSQLINSAFYAMRDTKITVVCSGIAVLTNIGLNLILVRPFGLAGLAIATSAAEFVGMLTRYILFSRKYKEIRLIKSKKRLLVVLAISLAAVLLSYLVYSMFGSLGLIIRFVVAALVAVALYLALMYIAKFEEIKLIRDLVKR